MVKPDRPLPDRLFYYIISGHNKSTLPLTNKCGAEHPARPTFSKSPHTLHFTQAG